MTQLSPARAARLVELRTKLEAPHLERCAQLRAAVQAELGDGWKVDAWPVRRYTDRALPGAHPGPLHIGGYRVLAVERQKWPNPRYALTYVDVGAWAPEAPNWQAAAFRRRLLTYT